jgi:hypothetical protein
MWWVLAGLIFVYFISTPWPDARPGGLFWLTLAGVFVYSLLA